MTHVRGIVLAGALMSVLPGVARAEPQPTSVSTATITLDLTPPDPFSAFSTDRMVALPDGTRFVLGSGASNSANANFLVKVNPNGAQAWAVSVADPFTASVTGLAADASGNAYVAYTDFSNFSEPHARVVKFNATGGVAANADLTTNTPGGDGFPFSEGVGVDSTRGRVYAAYSFFSNAQNQNAFAVAALDTNLQPVATRVYDPGFTGGLGVLPGGGTVVDGLGDVWVLALQIAPTPVPAMLAVRFAPDVASASPLPFDSPSPEELGAAADPRGGIVAAGDRQGDGNLYLHRVTASGGFGGQFRFEGFDSLPTPMAVDPAGSLYIAGFDPSTFSPAIAKITASNALAWDQPGPYLNLPDTFAPGAVAAAVTTLDVANVDFNANPIPLVLLHYQSAATSTEKRLVAVSNLTDSAPVSTQLASPLVVETRDTSNLPIGDVPVEFSITAPVPPGATGFRFVAKENRTNSAGRASSGFLLGNLPLEYNIKVDCPSCVGSANSVAFRICGELPGELYRQNVNKPGKQDYIDDRLANSTDPADSIEHHGCTLTAFTMLLNIFRSRYNLTYPESTPGTLNSALTPSGFSPVARLNLPVATPLFAGNQVRYVDAYNVGTFTSYRDVMTHVDDSLALGNPALVRLQSTTGALGHFVTVTGRCGSRYRVLDPYTGTNYSFIDLDDLGTKVILGVRIFERGN